MSVFAGVVAGGPNGKLVAVAATAIGSGTTVHTATDQTGDGQFDEISIYASNIDSVPHTLTVGWGGTTDADLLCKNMALPANTGGYAVITGGRLNNGLVVKAAADAANKINLAVVVNRVTG